MTEVALEKKADPSMRPELVTFFTANLQMDIARATNLLNKIWPEGEQRKLSYINEMRDGLPVLFAALLAKGLDVDQSQTVIALQVQGGTALELSRVLGVLNGLSASDLLARLSAYRLPSS